jgi:DNA-binding transcriptional MerR regulator
MSINEVSRCTGFPPDVLRSFAAQGLLPLANPSTANNHTMFDGQGLLRNLAELKNAR